MEEAVSGTLGVMLMWPCGMPLATSRWPGRSAKAAGELDVTVPDGTEAELALPDGTTGTVGTGTHRRLWK